MSSFECHQCGECCKSIRVLTIPDDFKNFPYRIVMGRCEKLTKDNKCSVYSHRPLVCNVQKLWENYYSDVINWQDFCGVNKQMCPK